MVEVVNLVGEHLKKKQKGSRRARVGSRRRMGKKDRSAPSSKNQTALLKYCDLKR
jgi:ribosomal protein L4